MRTIKYISAILIIITFAACGTTKKITQQPPVETPKITINSAVEMVKTLEENQPSFLSANASKMSVDVNFKGREMSMGAACQLVTDSAIHLSLMPFMGIELFKLELTPKEFILIDKMNKRYYINTYAYFKNHFGININYNDIQSIISNRLFLAEKKAYLPEDFSWKENSPTTLTLLANGEKTMQETKIDSLLLTRISQVIIKAVDYNYVLYTDYSDFKKTGEYLFPQKTSIKAEDNGIIKASFSFDIQKLAFNEPLTLKPTNLARYTPGNLDAFFKK
ncbi:conserved exported hypothetical protein [uncultured Paludibacter sp.]|nr:conserved exported hypothetical protein [uncultured Paludibacter sp.]